MVNFNFTSFLYDFFYSEARLMRFQKQNKNVEVLYYFPHFCQTGKLIGKIDLVCKLKFFINDFNARMKFNKILDCFLA